MTEEAMQRWLQAGGALAHAGCGLVVFLGACWALSERRGAVRWGQVGWALCVQVSLAILTQHVALVQRLFLGASDAIGQLKAATLVGTGFVFGYMGGAAPPFANVHPENNFVFAMQALPMVIVVSALSMLLFHWRILPFVVRNSAWLLQRTLNVGGALGVCAAAKIFLGMTEAPLLIRPYLKDLSRSELFSVMTLGMATTSASVMVLYATVLESSIAHPLSHILTASIISVPAALMFSRLMVPQQGKDTEGSLRSPYQFAGGMEAVATGATDGMKLFLNIIAMLLTMLALVALGNSILGLVSWANEPVTLQRLFGWVLAPVCWLMGLNWPDAQAAGRLLGLKLVLNEVLAFVEMTRMPQEMLSAPARLVMLYALCGFANLGSIGVLIGGFGTMAPERRAEVIGLGFKALLAGALASCTSGLLVGLLQSLRLALA